SAMTMLRADSSVLAIPTTALAIAPSSGSIGCLDLELIVDPFHARGHLSGGDDGGLLLGGVDRSAQRHHTVRGDDLHVVRVRGECIVVDDGFPYALRDRPVALVLALIRRRDRLAVAV